MFLCASSPDESGRQALDWALESLVQDEDELIVYRGVDPEDLGERPIICLTGLPQTLSYFRERS